MMQSSKDRFHWLLHMTAFVAAWMRPNVYLRSQRLHLCVANFIVPDLSLKILESWTVSGSFRSRFRSFIMSPVSPHYVSNRPLIMGISIMMLGNVFAKQDGLMARRILPKYLTLIRRLH
jgi:hypothetical protein